MSPTFTDNYKQNNGSASSYKEPNPLLEAAAAVAAAESHGNYHNDLTGNKLLQAHDIDSLIQVHRRKMLRRAANRRSAQLSRERKKAHMEDLKYENARLQRVISILNSQPELVFCVNIAGKVTYASERAENFLKISASEDGTDDESNMSNVTQFLTVESQKLLFEALGEVCNVNSNSNNMNAYLGRNIVSEIKEITFHDARGFPFKGDLRCSKLIRKNDSDSDNNQFSESHSHGNGSNKKARTSSSVGTSSVCNEASSGSETSNGSTSVGSSIQFSDMSEAYYNDDHASTGSNNKDDAMLDDIEREDEFICVIRHVDRSLPHSVGNDKRMRSGLSKASMDAHDLGIRNSNVEERRGSPNESNGDSSNNSSGSGACAKSDSSNSTNTTSSDTGSEDRTSDNGEYNDDPSSIFDRFRPKKE